MNSDIVRLLKAIAIILMALNLASCNEEAEQTKNETKMEEQVTSEETNVFANVTNEGGVLAIIQVKVKNPKKFMEYVDGHLPSLSQYGGKILFEGLNQTNVYGEQQLEDLVVVQLWDDEETFYKWWNSEEYRPWKEMRDEGAYVTLSISQQRPEKLEL